MYTPFPSNLHANLHLQSNLIPRKALVLFEYSFCTIHSTRCDKMLRQKLRCNRFDTSPDQTRSFRGCTWRPWRWENWKTSSLKRLHPPCILRMYSFVVEHYMYFLPCILRMYSLNVKLLHQNLAHLHASEAHRRHELHGRHFSRAWKTLKNQLTKMYKNVQKHTTLHIQSIKSSSSKIPEHISEYQVRQL